MTRWQLLFRNLLYHRRANSAVLLGVAVGTAVLTGALLVGDSLRGSLRELTLRRLGWIDEAMTAPQFFRAALADELHAERISPAILVQATATTVPRPGELPRMARHVLVAGVDDSFWKNWGTSPPSLDEKARLNSGLAHALDVAVGEQITLQLQKPGAIPRETFLGRRDSDSLIDKWTLDVASVLKDGEAGNAFNLKPELATPRIAFVPLESLQARLGQQGKVNAALGAACGPEGTWLKARSARLGNVNALLVGGGDELAHQLKTTLTLEDWGLVLKSEHRYLNLQSRRVILGPSIGGAALAAAKQAHLRAAPTLMYLANTIRSGTAEIPYSLVAALPLAEAAPLGPFLPPGLPSLADDEIVLADWNESPLRRLKRGDLVELSYFEPEQHAEPRERKETFRFAGKVPLAGVSADPDLAPPFPGITDKLKLDEWDPPFPFDNKRIKPRDEDYWRKYRTTPKAYVNLATGQRLWGSRFGNLTSVRLAGTGDLPELARRYEEALLQNLEPARGGFVFQPVKAQALAASAEGTDFSALFAYFSFFLIAAALLLVGLLFRLNMDRRAPEFGLLLATGYRPSAVRGLLLAEGAVVSTGGVLAGTLAALAYSGLLVRFLGSIWPGGQLSRLLQPHVTLYSLAVGGAGSLAVSLATIAWAVHVLGKVAPPALLRGQTATPESRGPGRPRWSIYLAGVSVLGAVALEVFGFFVKDHEAQAGAFFGSGSLWLVAGLAGLWAWMRGSGGRPVERGGWRGVGRLGVRNAARYPVRSLLTAGLLASAAFLLVVVEAFRRHAEPDSADIHSGSGGFALLGESDLPIFADLNNEAGREEMAEKLQIGYREALAGDNAAAWKRVGVALDLLRQCRVFAFRVRAGDDTSCLNLYRPTQPRLLGVPEPLLDRGGFQFASAASRNPEERRNPWLILDREEEEVPVFGENNTVVWMLHAHQGSTLLVQDGKGIDTDLRVDGLLSDSVFQSGLLMSDRRFLQLYPNQEGFTFFLVQTPPGREHDVQQVLDLALAERGFEATPTAERLDDYLAVENTYLTTFQALGGLGLILGSLGLGVVLLRSVWERRAELALLRALGWRRSLLGWLVLAENGFLLLIGLGVGTLAALLAIAPQAANAAAPPWQRLAVLLAAALAVGWTAGLLAVLATLRAPLVPALRQE